MKIFSDLSLKVLFVLSVGTSITLGMMDYETESFWHLFSEGGNIIALMIYIGLAFILWSLLYGIVMVIVNLFRNICFREGDIS